MPDQFQVTVPPLDSGPFDGVNELFATVTESVGAGGGGGGGGGAGGGGGGGGGLVPVLLPQAAANAIAAIPSKRLIDITASVE